MYLVGEMLVFFDQQNFISLLFYVVEFFLMFRTSYKYGHSPYVTLY